VEPNPDRTRVVGNVILRNGSGTANCFARNLFRTDFPAGITVVLPCG
jgi:hypothetical protein